MGAAVSACKKTQNLKNTGVVCKEMMGPTSQLWVIPPTAKWTKEDQADFTQYALEKANGPKAQRWYPLFGPAAPIRRITLNKTADVIFTADDNTQIFINYGVLNRAFSTTEAGLCYAEALMALLNSGYSIIEVDVNDQIMHRKNTDGTFSGLKTTFMYAPSIDTADFKNPGFVNFQISVDPKEYVRNGAIFQMDDSSLTDIMGLIDVAITDATGSSTTKLKIGAEIICSEEDLLAQDDTLTTNLAAIANFVVTNKSTGAPVTITAAAVVGNHIELTGTFVTATTYTVAGAGSDVWFGNDVEGYEAIESVDIAIP
ncbi:MAG TPA: hypothetical protein VGN00_14280 [Puia sp.]|jgi:hypothetical protein